MNNQLNALFAIVVCVVILLFIAGCATTPTPTPTPSLLGTWVLIVTKEESPTFKGYGEATFAGNGRYSLYDGAAGAIMVEGHYTITQDQIVVTDESGVCIKYGFPTATYKWSVANDSLTLTPIEDSCYNRKKLASLKAFSRKKPGATPFPTVSQLK